MVERIRGHIVPPSEARKKRVARNIEKHPAKEQELQVLFATLVIIGESGTGKTSAADMAVEILKTPKIFKVGDALRNKKNAHGQSQYIERDIEDDRIFDAAQIEVITESTPNEPWILESRLGGWLAKLNRDKNEYPVIIVRLTADEKTRHERIQRRLKKNGIEQTVEEIKKHEEERAKLDRIQWVAAHPDYPELNHIDPYGFYDFSIDNTNLSVKETFDRILEGLIKLGHIKIKSLSQEKPDLTRTKTSKDGEENRKNEKPAKKGTIFMAKGKGSDLDDIINKTSHFTLTN